jgi:hypothetical protein
MAFYPHRGAGQSVSPGSISGSVTVDKFSKAVRFHNTGATNVCYVRVGTSISGTPATTADTPVLPGTVLIVRKGDGEDTVSYISAAGTTLHIQDGEEY